MTELFIENISQRFIEPDQIEIQAQLTASFENSKISNSFVESLTTTDYNVYLGSIYLSNNTGNLSLRNKQKLSELLGFTHLTPRYIAGFENTSLGIEKLINMIRLDFLGYYVNQLSKKDYMSAFYCQDSLSFFKNLSEGPGLSNITNILKHFTLNEAFSYGYKIAAFPLGQPPACKLSKSNESKVDAAQIFNEDSVVLESLKRTAGLNISSSLFGDQKYL